MYHPQGSGNRRGCFLLRPPAFHRGTHYYSVPEPVDGEHEANYDNDGATGRYAMAAGVNTTAKGDYSTAVGGDSHINGERNVALGAGSYVGLKSLGYNYGVTGDVANSVAVGSYSNVISDKGTAVGASTNVFGEQNIAVGYSSTAAGETLNTAIGTNSKVGIRRYYYDYSTGQAYYVPSSMSYREWRASLMENQEKAFIADKKIREQHNADKKQLSEYRKLRNYAEKNGQGELFAGMGTKLADFQTMKYQQPEVYERIKENARIIRGEMK